MDYLDCEDTGRLFSLADEKRKEYCRDEVHLRGLIEFSNYCQRDCKYCGLRKSNGKVARYRMSEDEIFSAAEIAREAGCKTIVLQSGESQVISISGLSRLVERIKRKLNCAVTLSLGEKSYSQYRQLRDAGADRYLLKFETSNQFLFEELRPGSSYQDRLGSIEQLRQLGYQVGSGNIVGLPGQTRESLAEDILLMEKLDLDMIGIGPFIPHRQTPLRGAKKGSLGESLKVVALVRIIMGNVHIPATTALGSVHPQGRQMGLNCGANVIMPDVTPGKYQCYYQIYPGRAQDNNDPCLSVKSIESILSLLGRKIASDRGDSLRLAGRKSHKFFS